MIENELINEIDRKMDYAKDLTVNLYDNFNELNGTLTNIKYLNFLLNKVKNNNSDKMNNIS